MNTYDPAKGMVYRHMTRETDAYAIPGDQQEQYLAARPLASSADLGADRDATAEGTREP